jgi:hypothetical protein
MLLAPDAGGAETGPVEGIPEGDRLEVAGDELREFEGHLDRVRPPGTEEGAAKVPGGDLGQFLRQADGGNIGETARAEGERAVQLLPDGADDIRMVEAGVVDPVAVHVEVAAPREVFDPGALGAGDHVEDRRGEALVEEVFPVLLEPLPRDPGEVSLPVGLPGRRVVDIPLFGLGTQERLFA